MISHAPVVFVHLLVIALLSGVASATTCYDYSGAESGAIPCDATASTSSCCNPQDICLSNGLCLGVTVNNLLSIQGCTSQDWTSPCRNYCKESAQLVWGWTMFPCPNGEESGGSITYCCGPNGTTCCEEGKAFNIPVGTLLRNPVQLSTSSGASTSSTLAPLNSPTTSLSAITSTSSNSTSTSPTTPSNSANPKALGIGLGIGLPFGLILIGALIFLGWELRRYNNNRVATSAPIHTQPESFSDKAPNTSTYIPRQELEAQT